jgi:hypothetical protein
MIVPREEQKHDTTRGEERKSTANR